MMYNDIVQDCFFNPLHVGTLDLKNPFVVGLQREQLGQQNCVSFFVQCSAKGVILQASFKCNGNPYMIAALEWICRQSEGKQLDGISKFSHDELIKLFEIPTKYYPAAIYIEGICKEIQNLMMKKLWGKSNECRSSRS
ncbi:iron-sulfur cluster assembly scaffold protein [Legionella waltersii]|uniref:NifU family transporter iron binding protein n=1 Tax=Legionella waltersii TaxID=66969 RepID=A0A0W1AAP0_9GAMM|nr:iron-sulfur cluster assembly scaffold protein [Legionella waltersii]KTD78428.1 NifU family transporter iron binding protein [Legionella waltersii]SNV06091.1 NifU family iron binding protein [Fe-S] cluster formation/repair protein IscU, HesB [Legionella waltersii]